MTRKVGENKITKHAYFPNQKQTTTITEEVTNKDEEGEPNVTINGKPRDIQKFMNPKEAPRREFDEKDLEDVKFKGRDDDS